MGLGHGLEVYLGYLEYVDSFLLKDPLPNLTVVAICSVLMCLTMQRPDPVSTKRLCIITLTRIFLLTREYQTLLREITTPSFPAFITSSLNNVSSRTSSQDVRKPNVHSPLLGTVLEALAELLPHHPTSFRPFVSPIRSLILPLLAPTPSNLVQDGSTKTSIVELGSFTSPCTAAAQRLFVLLHCCAAKNTSGDEWNKTTRTIIVNIHNTTDQVFRAVFEDWEPSNIQTNITNPKDYGTIVSSAGLESLGLPPWKGIHAGCERLSGLMLLLQSSLATQNSAMVSLPVGAVVDVITRVLSLLVPATTDQRPSDSGPRLNPEITREEREALWARLPQIHVAALKTYSTLLARLGAANSALSHGLLDVLLWVYRSESTLEEIRTSIYGLVAQILVQVGPSLPRSLVSSMSPLIRACCKDLLPPQERTAPNKTTPGNKTAQSNWMSSTNADSFLVTAMSSKPQIRSPELQSAAVALLPLLLMCIPQNTMSFSLRSQIDRTAILSQNKDAMLASVLNPPTGQKGSSSIMPLLARGFPESPAVEAVIRPRMPVLQRRRDDNGDIESDEDDDMDLPYNNNTNAGNGLGSPDNAWHSQEMSEQLGHGIDVVDTEMAGANADSTVPPFTAAMHEVESPNLHISNKRGRDDSGGEVAPTTDADPITSLPESPQQSGSPTIKRVRHGNGAADPDTAPASHLRHAVVDSGAAVGHSGQALSTAPGEMPAVLVPFTTSAGAIGANADSDDDDFEIPPLDMGLDTDEEDDEEDE